MAITYRIELDDLDLGQLLDALEIRAKAWRDTAEFLRSGNMTEETFVLEECSDAEEAEKISAHYDRITDDILRQRAAQDSLAGT